MKVAMYTRVSTGHQTTDNQLIDLLTKSDNHFIILKKKVEQFIKMGLQNINDYIVSNGIIINLT